MSKNSIRFHADEWRGFKDFLIGNGFREEQTKGEHEICRMRHFSANDPILIHKNTKDESLVVHGGRGPDLWYEFIQG